MTNRLRKFPYIAVVAAVVCCVLAISIKNQMEARQRRTALEAKYAVLLQECQTYNLDVLERDQGGYNSWSMSTEHLFVVGDGQLWRIVEDFDRQPDAIDFLFDRLLSHPGDDEVLRIREILGFAFGQLGNDSIHGGSSDAESVLAAVRAGQFAGADRKYPQVVPSIWIAVVAHAALAAAPPSHKPEIVAGSALAAVIFAAAGWRIIRLRAIRARRAAGLCAVCNYDLRASKDRCPECGTAIPPRPFVA